MCAPSPRIARWALGVAHVFLAAVAQAQTPGISGTEPSGVPAASGAVAPPTPVAAPSVPVPAFTPVPAPTFTPAPVATSTPVVGTPTSAPVPFAPVASVAPPTPIDARAGDAHVDHVVLVPTAETHPAGTVYLSSYEIVGIQAGYALGDRTELTLSFAPPLAREVVVPLDLTLKAVLVRSRRVRVAAMGSATGIFGVDEGETAIGRAGGVVTLCFDDGCRSSVSTAANLALAGPALILFDGIGAVLRTTDLFAFLVELESVVPISREGSQLNGMAGALGVRFSGRRWAVDLAVDGALDKRRTPQAIPLLIASYRFL